MEPISLLVAALVGGATAAAKGVGGASGQGRLCWVETFFFGDPETCGDPVTTRSPLVRNSMLRGCPQKRFEEFQRA